MWREKNPDMCRCNMYAKVAQHNISICSIMNYIYSLNFFSIHFVGLSDIKQMLYILY